MARLDLDFVRENFPSFRSPMIKNWALFDNGAGSLLAKQVIDKLNYHMLSLKVLPYSRYTPSRIAGENVDDSYRLFAQSINADDDEIIFNASTSLNNYVLANAFRYELNKNDEIIVTNQDHESNIGFWYRLADQDSGVIIREWQVSSETGELDIKDLENLLNSNTKLLCFSHCSSVVGDIKDVKKITKMAHEVGAKVLIDGVSHMPHDVIDVKDLNIDFYAYSIYKTYGPHLGLLYGKKKHLERMNNQGHYFNTDITSKKFSPAGPQYMEIACASGVIDYYLKLYDHHFQDDDLTLHKKLKKVHNLFQQQEYELCLPIIDYLREKSNIRIIGSNKMEFGKRSSNISFLVQGRTSTSIVDALIKRGIATNNYHFYSKRLTEAIGITDPDDGFIRFSLLHYNSMDDVNKALNALDTIL